MDKTPEFRYFKLAIMLHKLLAYKQQLEQAVREVGRIEPEIAEERTLLNGKVDAYQEALKQTMAALNQGPKYVAPGDGPLAPPRAEGAAAAPVFAAAAAPAVPKW